MQCPKCDRYNKEPKWVCACGKLLKVDILRHEVPADKLPGQGQAFADKDCTERLAPDDQVTVRFDPVESLSEIFMGRVAAIPTGNEDVDTFALPPLELYVLSHIDGKIGAPELIKLTGLKRVELSVTLIGLMRSGAVTTTQHVSVETQAGEVDWQPQRTDQARKEFEKFEIDVVKGNITGASLHLKKAVALEPNEEHVKRLEKHMVGIANLVDQHYTMIRQDLASMRVEAAIDRIKKAIGQFSHEAGFYNLMAIAQLSNGRIDVAYKALEKAVSLDPSNNTYKANLAKLTNPEGSRETSLEQ